MTKKTESKDKFFVLWPADGDYYEANEHNTYEEALEAAELFLKENEVVDGVYYIAKATDKISYEKKHEKL